MKAVVLADKNNRVAIACIRSLVKNNIPYVPAFSKKIPIGRSYLRFTKYSEHENPALRYSDESAEEFCESLMHFTQEIGPYVLFPSGEKVMRWALDRKKELNQAGITIPAPNVSVYEALSDKASFVKLCEEHGLNVPQKYENIPTDPNVKFVVKAKAANIDAENILAYPFLVCNKYSLEDFKSLKIDMVKHFFQEYIEGASYYYCALYDQGYKRMDMVQKTLVQQPDGKSVVKAELSTLPIAVKEKIDHMMQSLEYHGAMMFELRKCESDYFAIECNARLWGPLQLAVDNGVDFPYALWCLATGKTHEPSDMKVAPVGYRWGFGYVSGWWFHREARHSFQKQSSKTEGSLIFKDVWGRSDTFVYCIFEFITFLLVRMRNFIKRGVSKLQGIVRKEVNRMRRFSTRSSTGIG
jgi:predicted ATP-grasp superfamily ATP-dependent carboligase